MTKRKIDLDAISVRLFDLLSLVPKPSEEPDFGLEYKIPFNKGVCELGFMFTSTFSDNFFSLYVKHQENYMVKLYSENLQSVELHADNFEICIHAHFQYSKMNAHAKIHLSPAVKCTWHLINGEAKQNNIFAVLGEN